MLLLPGCALFTVRAAVHRVGADENWADRYGRKRPGQRHRAGHPWLPRHSDDPGTGQVAWDASHKRGRHVRPVLRPSRLAALRWPQRPAAVVPSDHVRKQWWIAVRHARFLRRSQPRRWGLWSSRPQRPGPRDGLTGSRVSVPVPIVTLIDDPYNLLLFVRNVVSQC